MVAACDMAVASEDAVFSLTETRWGITPAPVMPALIAAMGPRALGRYALTGERFGASEAQRLGLVHAVCTPGGLDQAAEPIIEGILMAAPEAIGGDQAPHPRMPWLGGPRRRPARRLPSRVRSAAIPSRRWRGWRASPRSGRRAGIPASRRDSSSIDR